MSDQCQAKQVGAVSPWVWLPVIVAGLLLPALGSRIQPGDYDGGRSRDVQRRADRNSSAVAAMLGDFRTSASDIMYIKTERYMHSGMGVAGCEVQKVQSVAEESKQIERYQVSLTAEVEDKVEDYVGENLMPSSVEDFRGFIGDLHRKVLPYQPPGGTHEHADGQELLPWFRLMTMSDPHYVRGYSIGGWWLATKNLDEALAFVEEGIEKNPRAYQIHYMRGQILMKVVRNMSEDGAVNHVSEEVLPLAQQARDAYRDAARFAIEARPVGGMENVDGAAWGRYEEDDTLASMRLSIMTELAYGDSGQALTLAKTYVAVIPDDRVLNRLLNKATAAVKEKGATGS